MALPRRAHLTAAAAALAERRLVWDACFNARDLGGLPTGGRRHTAFGAIIRSDTPDRLTAGGWAAVRRYGVRTIVDLRDPAEYGRAEYKRTAETPAGIDVLRVPVLDLGDGEFWAEGRWRTAGQSADFFLAALDRWPARFADAVAAIARAKPGGVVVHCQAGRDRTGVVTAAVLTLAGVQQESIAADYALSAPSLQPLYDSWLAAATDEETRDRIRMANRSDVAEIRRVLADVDLGGLLLAHGLTAADVERLHQRLLD